MTQPNAIGYYSDSEDTVSSLEEWRIETEMKDEQENPFKVPIGLAPYPLNIGQNGQDCEKDFVTLKDSLKKAKEALSTGRYSLLVKRNVAYPKSSKNTQIVIGSSPDLKRQKTMSGKKQPGSKVPSLKKEQ